MILPEYAYITVNGVQHRWLHPEIRYDDVVNLAGEKPHFMPSVKWTAKDWGLPSSGILYSGTSVRIKHAMKFTVIETGNA